ncbi:MAG TPA: hypothetical protein VFD92_17815 [Candidatus Binatia bacterium]|nr:hypothetical protein [Candidatus Binatia bacterium]
MNQIAVQRQLTQSAVSSNKLSSATKNVLFQRDLVALHDQNPAAAIAAMHALLVSGAAQRSDVFATAELCFDYARESDDPGYDRAAAVYAWMFLFPEHGTPLDPFDTRVRVAADIYNLGVARGFGLGPDGEFVPREGSYPVPFGQLDVYFDPEQLRWSDRRLVKFVPVADFEVEGLPTRYRWSGVGAPLAASTEPLDPNKGYQDFIQPWVKVPVTALLRMDDVESQLRTGRVAARLTLERAFAKGTADIDGKRVPLESESSASLAYMLAESPVWQREIGGFLQRIVPIAKGTQLAGLAPYRPGRIPIVFVHGTASSPGRWAEMMNELGNDPRIGPRVQGWLFMYDTGNPIVYSAMLLRESLRDAVAQLDPEGKDPALRDMVVIGHSQGGLLTKMSAIDSGSRFWDLVSSRPIEDFDATAEDKDLLRRMAFIQPVPSVRRVIFLATPHHGSYVAGSWFAQQAAKLIVLPANMMRIGTDVVTRNKAMLRPGFTGLNTSVLGMTPGSPLTDTLLTIPLAPGVKGHSIIAVNDDTIPREEAADGVVEYSSAHIEGVESELVVVSGHSCQDNPHTIQEVKRILLEHIAEYDATHAAAAAAAGAASAPPPTAPADAPVPVSAPGAAAHGEAR